MTFGPAVNAPFSVKLPPDPKLFWNVAVAFAKYIKGCVPVGVEPSAPKFAGSPDAVKNLSLLLADDRSMN